MVWPKEKERAILTVMHLHFFILTVYLGGNSLVAQWLRIRLPMQGTRVQALVQKIPHAMEQLGPCATTTEPAL